MTGERRKFRREGEERRREALISAALGLIREGGFPAATVRAIAERAGVTPGLIRHYFASKDDLTLEAYRALMDQMTAISLGAVDIAADPLARIAGFALASLRPPVLDAAHVSLWAGFLHLAHNDPEVAAVHEATYLGYRDRLQDLIAALPEQAQAGAAAHRALAIACNAVIDGLWLEGGLLPSRFAPGELEQIALRSMGAMLGADLVAAACRAGLGEPAWT